MAASPVRVRLALDLGNTLLKWGLVSVGDREIGNARVTKVDDAGSWAEMLEWYLPEGAEAEVAVASVSPPAADRLAALLDDPRIRSVRWFRSAADVPVKHALEHPGRTGVDRALAVMAAMRLADRPGPGIVVQCGTAITVERIGPDGTWQGGAIAIGPGLVSRSLHAGTAQLPEVPPIRPGDVPPAWGSSTVPALTAGVIWGAVGAVKELVARQSIGLDPPPWIIWTGGDAPSLGPLAAIPGARIVPDVVLYGLARAAFGVGEP